MVNLEIDVSELPLPKQMKELYRFLRVYDKYSRAFTRSLNTVFQRNDPIERDRWAQRGVYNPSMHIEFLHPPKISNSVNLRRYIPPFFLSCTGCSLGMIFRSLIVSKRAWKEMSGLSGLKRSGNRLYYQSTNALTNETITMGKKTYIPLA